jgi:FimV-like protein
MISLIFKSYFAILLSIGVGTLAIFILGLYLIFRPQRRSTSRHVASVKPQTKIVVTSHDISAIAGDDVIATQLDLARAYIETGRHLLAKKILEYVRDHGSISQQQEAQRLLSFV